MLEDEHLIDRLKARYPARDTTNFTVMDFVFAEGSPLTALLYSRLFWPEFVEIQRGVFLKEVVDDPEYRRRLEEAIARQDANLQDLEKSFNLVEVPSGLFGEHLGDTTDEEDEWLAQTLAEMWAGRLAQLFPSKQFVVESTNVEETGGEIGVWFYQKEENPIESP